MTLLSFWSFLSSRPGIGVLGPPRREAPRTPIPGRNLRKLQKLKKVKKVIKVIKVKKVKKIGCGPCGRPQEGLGKLLGGPRTRIPGA